MKKSLLTIVVFALVTMLTVLGGCTESSVNSTQKINVITSFYPLYEIVKKIGGEKVTIRNIVPAGAEPHEYEPTPKDIVALNEADLVVVNGLGLEPWAKKALTELPREVKILNLSEALNASSDPHIWLDPVNYSKEAQFVAQKLSEIEPAEANIFQENAQKYIKELQELDQTFKSGLNACGTNNFVTNHAAFGYLAKRYNLNMIAISGLSPEAEPSPKEMAELSETIRQKKIKFILTESLVSPKIADTLANETGAQTLILNPLEGLTDEEIAQGKNYVTVMRDNLKNLQTAMECK